jgi:hypothetical protein
VSTSSSFATSAQTATSASFATSAASATSASFATNAATATSSSFATNANTATSSSFATSAASATSASFATNATLAATASFLPSTTNLNVASITANSGSFQVLSAVSASFGYVKTVTGSAVIVGEEFIILNADTPAAPFAGVVVYDSGSASTASFEWNGNTDNWITVEENGFSAMVLTGISGSKGSEVAPSSNKLLKGTGNNTVADSTITDNGTNVTFTTPIAGTAISASTGFNGNLTGTASFATSASFAPSVSPFPFTGSAVITGSLTITGSIVTGEPGNTATGNRSAVIGGGAGSGINQAGGTNSVVAGGYLGNAAGTNCFIGGGGNSRITAGDRCGLVGGFDNQITAGDANFIGGGANAVARGSYSAIVGGNLNLLGTNGTFNGIVGGTSNTIGNFTNTVILGGSNITAAASNTAYVPNFVVSGSTTFSGSFDAKAGGTITGSLNVENTASIGLVRISSHIGNSQAFIAATSNDLNIGNASYSQAMRLVGSELIFSNVRTSFPAGNDLKFLGGFQSTGSATITGSLDVNGSVTGNVLGNNTDTYTGSAAIQQVVTLTQTEYNAISGSANANTLYVISDSVAFSPAGFATTGSNTFNGNQIISGSLNVTGGITGSMLGTASFAVFATGAGGANSATSASYALSASFANLAITGGGLISGTGGGATTAMRSAPYLTTTPATASGANSIALGSGATTNLGNGAIAIGTATQAAALRAVVVGNTSMANGSNAVAIGYNVTASGTNGVNINGIFNFDGTTIRLSNSTVITGSLTVSGSQVITGSLRGNVSALSIASNTASLDCSTDNFFTLTLVSGSNTFINPSNIAAGQTINLRVTQANPGNGTVSFPTSVKQVSGSSYVPSTGAGPQDIVTFISFDASSLYLSNVKNLV